MTDVEIISKLCRIDSEIRNMKKKYEELLRKMRQSGMTELPAIVKAAWPAVLMEAKHALRIKRELRVQLWKEYGIFYWSDV